MSTKFSINRIDIVSEDQLLKNTIDKLMILNKETYFECPDRPIIMDKINMTDFIDLDSFEVSVFDEGKKEEDIPEWICLKDLTFQVMSVQMKIDAFYVDLIILEKPKHDKP